MDQPTDPAAARRWFAEDLRIAAPVHRTPAIIDAFARVPREDYLGPGPWRMHARTQLGRIHTSPSDHPGHLYHDLLVAIDESRDLNNGLPSLWAYVFDHLDIAPGKTVLQVGTGLGYFTAILAELVGPTGQVLAIEIDPDLAARARANLSHYDHVTVRAGDATQADNLPRIDALAASAGVTHVPDRWLSQLTDGGRMMLPLTGPDNWGIMMLLTRDGGDIPVRSLGPCGFYPCNGARHDDEATAIRAALANRQQAVPDRTDGDTPPSHRYHTGQPTARDAPWLTGRDYWISAD